MVPVLNLTEEERKMVAVSATSTWIPQMLHDPLMTNLDAPPSLISKAFDGSITIPWLKSKDGAALTRIFNDASLNERELAEKAARASISVRQYRSELRSWQWPDTFDKPKEVFEDSKAPTTPIRREHQSETRNTPQGNRTYWGCLPASTVLSYKDRIEIIENDLDRLGFEDVKARIRGHQVRSSNSLVEDLPALTVVLVLQTLPIHVDLHYLLATWTARVYVLQRVPDFMEIVSKAEASMVGAWTSLGNYQGGKYIRPYTNRSKAGSRGILRDVYERLRGEVEGHIARLGRRTDAMLDILANQEDTLPDAWIDIVENLEVDYSNWTVEAQKKVLLHEFWTNDGQEDEHHFAPTPDARKDARSFSTPSKITTHRAFMPGTWENNEDDEGNKPLPKYSELSQRSGLRPFLSQAASLPHLQDEITTGSGPQKALFKPDWPLQDTLDANVISFTPMAEGDGSDEMIRRARKQSFTSSRDGFLWPQVPGSTWPLSYEAHRSKHSSLKNAGWNNIGGGNVSPPSTLSEHTDPGSSEQENLGKMPTSKSGATVGLGISNVDMLNAGRRVLQRLDTGNIPLLRVPTTKRMPSPERLSQSPTVVPYHSKDAKQATSELPSYRNIASTEEQIEQRIGGILATVPADIRFAKDGPQRLPKRVATNAASSNVALMNTQRQVSLTITPAYQKEQRVANLNANSDIKLYHLNQTNEATAAPIKLFLRLVGNDRVMVRVGGGWADLGEWLRAYTTHHSSATFIQTDLPLLSPSTAASPLTRVTTPGPSSPASPTRRPLNAHASRLPVKTGMSPLASSPTVLPIRSMTTSRQRTLSSSSGVVSPSLLRSPLTWRPETPTQA